MYSLHQSRRHFLGNAAYAAMTLTVAQLGLPAVVAASKARPAVSPGMGDNEGARVLSSFGPLKQINAGELNIGYVDAGPVNGPVVLLLHGWPYDIHSYAEVTPMLTERGFRVIVPYLRGYGTTTFLSPGAFRNGQQAVLAVDAIALMDALKVEKAVVAGFDWGSRTADIMAALWPQRCKALVSVSGYLIVNRVANMKPLSPKAELGWWYQYYFATERGRNGYDANRVEFGRLIWDIASPKWNFDDATYQQTAASFSNPDHVDIVIHNYRWRLSLAEGDPKYDELENKLSQGPVIKVPAITIASDFDGANADGKAYAGKFSGKYAHKILNGIGHNVPQEAPRAFADAVIEVSGY